VGTAIAFDPRRDLALVHVPSLGLRPLGRRDAAVGAKGAVFGHPAGGDLRIAPARVADRIVAVGTDIYRTRDTRRDVLVTAAHLVPGDSGAPLVDERGMVMGVAFAIDPAHPDTSYALTTAELDPVLATAREHREHSVPTGSCVVN
jgi:S1-C subfamily serine protease